MESLWTHYAKTQLNVGRTFEDEHSDIEPRTKQQEVHAWEDWSLQNFQGPALVEPSLP